MARQPVWAQGIARKDGRPRAFPWDGRTVRFLAATTTGPGDIAQRELYVTLSRAELATLLGQLPAVEFSNDLDTLNALRRVLRYLRGTLAPEPAEPAQEG